MRESHATTLHCRTCVAVLVPESKADDHVGLTPDLASVTEAVSNLDARDRIPFDRESREMSARDAPLRDRQSGGAS
jgi:hypothetical protein